MNADIMDQRLTQKLGFLGGGVMAEAIIRGIIEKKLVDPASVIVYDVVKARLEVFQKIGVQTCSNSADVLQAQVIILAVKPDIVEEALKAIKSSWKPQQHLLVSICAGVTITKLESHLIDGSRVVRVMPNTPCLVGEAAVGFSRGSHATVEDEKLVETIFSSVGVARCVPEKLLDAVTGVSGSGPAYVYMFVEALADGGVVNGLPRDVALSLAAQTVLGAAKMLLKDNEHPAKLRNAVESPGGTTIHGTTTLEKYQFRRKETLKKRKSCKVSFTAIEKLICECKKNWDLFYKRNGTRFFRDRYWVLNTPEEDGFYMILDQLLQKTQKEGRQLVLLEAGCGVGNTLFPILTWSQSIYFYACDFSPEAIRLVEENPKYDSNRMTLFVCDFSKESLNQHILCQVDVIFLFFSLSAVPPRFHKDCIVNMTHVLKPGGYLVFRDFCDGDLAQKRFSKDNTIDAQWFFRQDGTFSYFFQTEFVQNLFEKLGFETISLKVIDRKIENRKQGKTMERCWLQGMFQWKPNGVV
eukprot:jgi/Galph1/4431/GphlegSOOS_G3097.1